MTLVWVIVLHGSGLQNRVTADYVQEHDIVNLANLP